MSTVLVLGWDSAPDGPARADALLQRIRALGLDARPLLAGSSGWALGTDDAHFATLADAALATDPQRLLSAAGAGTRALLSGSGPAATHDALRAALGGAGIALTGGGPQAFELASDRLMVKLAASRLGARCAGHEEVSESHRPYWTILQRVGLPCAVRPVRSGTDCARLRVADEGALRPAVATARAADPQGRCLIEEWLPGRAVSAVVVVRDGAPELLPLVEPATRPGAMPSEGQSLAEPRASTSAPNEAPSVRLPAAPLDSRTAAELGATALALVGGLGLDGVARVDFLVPEAPGRAAFVDLDPCPDLDSAGSVCAAFRAAGRGDRELLESVLESAR